MVINGAFMYRVSRNTPHERVLCNTDHVWTLMRAQIQEVSKEELLKRNGSPQLLSGRLSSIPVETS